MPNEIDSETELLRNSEYASALAIDSMVQIKLDLEKGGPIVLVLARAREKAIEAMKLIAHVDPTKTESVMLLQNEILRYDDLCKFIMQIIGEGETKAAELGEEEVASIVRGIFGEDPNEFPEG